MGAEGAEEDEGAEGAEEAGATDGAERGEVVEGADGNGYYIHIVIWLEHNGNRQ